MNDTQPSSLLRHYAALECASQEMLEAARAGDWDSVCRLEGACAVVIARMSALTEQIPLQPHEQGERLRILRSILANDAQIRRLCQPLPAMLDMPAFALGMQSTALH